MVKADDVLLVLQVTATPEHIVLNENFAAIFFPKELLIVVTHSFVKRHESILEPSVAIRVRFVLRLELDAVDVWFSSTKALLSTKGRSLIEMLLSITALFSVRAFSSSSALAPGLFC